MTTKEILKKHLVLMLVLGAIALVRPVMKITGVMDLLGQQFGSILMTVLISLIWLIVVLRKKVSSPVTILVGAGLSYALFAILLSGIVSPLLDGKLQGPLTNPLALVSIFTTNAVWGLLIGGIAKLLQPKH
ncbi:hypothetical protein [Paenibacillus brevis]|uniref:Phage holin family protein n=1 Tax=Paenibacillus brevis TaxID=2841508 RepID=A0ABS6FL18_9BACL|nr:hypothetical protein [Paenibacillus brevis]MBU5670684.1 hypothetical protein [Paenibacillus brevis]